MNSIDWHAALTVALVGIVICQAGALHTAWGKRDYWFLRSEERRVDWLEQVAENKRLARQLAAERGDDKVLPFRREPLDERAGFETWTDGA